MIGLPAAVAFVASVALANWLTTTLGFVPVGFGLEATAGTYVAGFALALRDLVQDTLGRLVVVVLIVAGAALSFVVAAPMIAIASGVAFLLSEVADLAIYTPLRGRAVMGGRRWSLAVLASGLVGAVVDTVVFLWIAFGVASIGGALAGQLLGKLWATLLFLVLVWGVRRALLRQPEHG